jgi:[ribosomal protein S5]-alanine N-acetyltransferase
MAEKQPVDVAVAHFPEEGGVVRELLREYETGLGIPVCFQGFEKELAGLPGGYAAGMRGSLLLARIAGEPAGCVAVKALDDGSCEMKRLFVRPQYRRSGAGRELAMASMDAARSLGYRMMRLHTLPVMARAVDLYRSLGFKETERFAAAAMAESLFFELDLEGETAPLAPLPDPLPRLETERLVVRPMTLDDAPRLQALINHPDVARYTSSIPWPYPEGAAIEYLNAVVPDYRKHGKLTFAVVPREAGELCGGAGLVVDFRNRKAELGYWIGIDYQGRGYATEAARAVLGFGFERAGLRRIHARVFSGNPRSSRVLEKIGMCKEGRQREHMLRWGEYKDIIEYGMLAREWNRVGAGTA